MSTQTDTLFPHTTLFRSEKIEANNNNPTEDLKDALAHCPAEVTDIFRTGSLLSHAASRVGASDWASVMRARVGDVYMRWDDGDRVPLFTAIPQCPAQDTESAQDFLTGRVQRRTLNFPPPGADCAPDGSGRGAPVPTGRASWRERGVGTCGD